ncbi:proline/glycine betaine ABC transporter permease [Marmoricola sp. Leaf446]|uniref:ABC transporter permease n=1 Tax=Marmoricola sp. Leaf446 TaxID=1736379 RepID=UPI0009EADC5D|nr:ABC transporter permease subunit [Marmoricola sp. Leaf446]
MSTATDTTTPAVDTTPAASPEPEARSGPSRWVLVVAVVVGWVLLWLVVRGQDTLQLAGRERTDVMRWLGEFRDGVIASRDTNALVAFTGAVGEGIRTLFGELQQVFSLPAFPRPVPQIGWLGVVALATWAGTAVANLRIAVLVAVTFVSYGVLGYWEQGIDLLLVTGLSVAAVVVIGMPLAVAVGTSRRARAVITPVLDAMQTMPTFVYLLPVVLFFGIGVSSAIVCTLVYALPPLIRIGGYGISAVSTSAIEATDSTGQTSWQRLRKVQLPLARTTIVVGLNQSTMAALSMAIIASYVDGPGLGEPVLSALIRNDVGASLVPGLLIVLTAIMLDRATTAASERAELAARGRGLRGRARTVVLGVGGVVVLVCVYLSRTYLPLAAWPETSLGRDLADTLDSATDAVVGVLGGAGEALRNAISYGLLNPMQSLLAESPWWLAASALVLVSAALGGLRAVVPTVVFGTGILLLGLWHSTMLTLTMVLVATVLVMVIALVLGVWMARSRRVDLLLRPLLDAGQTIPAFCYLIPVLALFGFGRFAAIAAAIVYAAPAAIKLVADGVRAVPETTLEASRSTGTTSWQEITQVQLPMARGSLALAANQGLLYVLAMIVIGGLVGAQALGYDVVLGFSRSEEWGLGAAAGITIVLLGLMLDRVARAAADRTGGRVDARSRFTLPRRLSPTRT